jgi:hypothetical protein
MPNKNEWEKGFYEEDRKIGSERMGENRQAKPGDCIPGAIREGIRRQ